MDTKFETVVDGLTIKLEGLRMVARNAQGVIIVKTSRDLRPERGDLLPDALEIRARYLAANCKIKCFDCRDTGEIKHWVSDWIGPKVTHTTVCKCRR